MSDRIVAFIRTAVPAAVGAGVTWAAKHLGLQLDSTGLTASAVTVATGAYYFVVSSVERKWPSFGVLLGVPKTPSYSGAQPPFDAASLERAATLLGQLLPPGTEVSVPAQASTSRLLVELDSDGTPHVTTVAPPA